MKPKPGLTRARYFQIGIGVVISGLALVLAFKNVNLREVGQSFARANPFFALLALASVAANTLAKVLRWQVLFGPEKSKIGFSPLLNSFLAGQMLNAFVPVRVGELCRIYVVGGKGVGRTFVLGTIAIEKVLDMFCYALLFILLLLLIPLPEWIAGSGVAIIGLTLSLLLLVLLVAYQRHRMIRWLDWAGRRLPASICSYLAGHVRLGLDSLEVFQHSQELLKLAGWSALIWGLALLTNQLVLLAFGIHLPWTASVLLLVALQAGISIPSIPGKIGIFEYICVLALAVFRIDPSIALSYGILLNAVVYLPMLLAGLISFWLLGLGRWSAELA